MKKIILLFFIVTIFIMLSYNQKSSSPSAGILNYYNALQSVDVRSLKKSMTKSAYIRLIKRNLPEMEGTGKVFAYDKEYFSSDPQSLKRMDDKLEALLHKKTDRYDVELIGQDAPEESVRTVHFRLNGERKKAQMLLEDGKWKVDMIE